MIKQKLAKKAFTLLEMCMSMMVIGALIVGVNKLTNIINRANVQGAMALSSKSPVNTMDGLVLWLDAVDSSTVATSLTGAVGGSGTYGNPMDSSYVTDWKNKSIQIASAVTTVSAAAGTNDPKYIQKSPINKLPSLLFDGANDYLSSATAPLYQGSNQFTYVAVWQQTAAANASVMEQYNNGSTTSAGNRAALLLTSGGTYGFDGDSANYRYEAATITYNTPKITVMTVTMNSGAVSIYDNSRTSTNNGSFTSTDGVISNAIFTVGAEGLSAPAQFMNGYISELMVFNRCIQPNEAFALVTYLSKKYNITVS